MPFRNPLQCADKESAQEVKVAWRLPAAATDPIITGFPLSESRLQLIVQPHRMVSLHVCISGADASLILTCQLRKERLEDG